MVRSAIILVTLLAVGSVPGASNVDLDATTPGGIETVDGPSSGTAVDATLYLVAWDQRTLPVAQGYGQASLQKWHPCLSINADVPMEAIRVEARWEPAAPGTGPLHLILWGPWGDPTPLASWDLSEPVSEEVEPGSEEVWFTLAIEPDSVAVHDAVDLQLAIRGPGSVAAETVNCIRR